MFSTKHNGLRLALWRFIPLFSLRTSEGFNFQCFISDCTYLAFNTLGGGGGGGGGGGYDIRYSLFHN